MKKIINLGEEIRHYKIKILNERELRAGTGVLFLLSFTAFIKAFWLGNFYLMKIFVVILLIDFVVRLFVDPKYSPSLVLGKILVASQKPKYVAATQKRFAWSLGLVLSVILLGTLVIFNLTNFVSLIICGLFSLLFFLESAFGVCMGCRMYSFFHKEKEESCPDGNCESKKHKN